MTPEDIFNTLEDLKVDEFKDFKWYLKLPEILEGYQYIKQSKLESAERRDTVDLMVNTFTLDGALKVTMKILEKIKRNDLVQSLSANSSGAEVSVNVGDIGETSENRGPSSSQSEGKAAVFSGKHFVDKHQCDLIAKVSNIGPILDHLLKEGVIQQEDYDTIRTVPTTQEKMRELYSGPLKAGGQKAKDIFFQILKEKVPYLVADLKSKES